MHGLLEGQGGLSEPPLLKLTSNQGQGLLVGGSTLAKGHPRRNVPNNSGISGIRTHLALMLPVQDLRAINDIVQNSIAGHSLWYSVLD